MSQTFVIFLTPRAQKMLHGIIDRRVREKIMERIDALTHDPDKQGKALTEELLGYRSLRAVGQRYRIIYCVERKKVTIIIIGVGIRKEGSEKDIYALAQKLIRLRLA